MNGLVDGGAALGSHMKVSAVATNSLPAFVHGTRIGKKQSNFLRLLNDVVATNLAKLFTQI